MPSRNAKESAVGELDRWFSNRCNGVWEHRYGMSIATTDNPGWLLTFNSLSVNSPSLQQTIDKLLRDYGAEVIVTEAVVKIFCRSLRGCLDAAAELLPLETSTPGSSK
ncbi:MAG TPA: Imm53 family immunity protein [Schlesneria sp.]|jgi:hypothetical protein